MAKSKSKPDLGTASREELVSYIRRLEASRDQVQRNNKTALKYANRVNEAVCYLAADASLAFQAMAEKAGVRGHPSVSSVVAHFDSLVGFQWGEDAPPKIDFPEDWDFDAADQWSGDADMQLNAPIARLLEVVESLKYGGNFSPEKRAAIADAINGVERAMRTHIDGIKQVHGFTTMTVDVSSPPHGIGWALLDLAQDMSFANEMLRRDLRASVYRRVCADLYRLSHSEHEEGPQPLEIKVLGGPPIPF